MLCLTKLARSGLAAVLLALLAPAALAQSFNFTAVTYATQAVQAASGALTVPAGIQYNAGSFSSSAAGSALITFTLPSGVTFTTTPIATVNGVLTSAVLASGGTGFGSVSFTLAYNTVTNGTGSIYLGSFTIAGATALYAPNPGGATALSAPNGINIAEQITGATNISNGSLNEGPLSLTFARSGSQLLFITQYLPLAVVDINPSAKGEQFLVGGVDTLAASIGNLQLGTNAFANATDTGPFHFTGTTTTLTIGPFNLAGIASAYLAPAGTLTCAATPPGGSTIGTISSGIITFSGVTAGLTYPGAAAQAVCLIASGTQIIAGYEGDSFHEPDVATTASIDTTMQYGGTLYAATYNGHVRGILYSDSTTVYAASLRISNRNPTAATVTAFVQADGGSTGSATVESALAGKNNDTVSVASIITASGVTLTANSEVSMTVLYPFGVGVEQLLRSPNGTLGDVH